MVSLVVATTFFVKAKRVTSIIFILQDQTKTNGTLTVLFIQAKLIFVEEKKGKKCAQAP